MKTVKNRKDAHKKLTLDELRRLFEKEGLRLTHQRVMIYNIISEAKDHPSAEAIYERIKKDVPTISLDTVYRTLSTLEHLGLIRRVQIFDHIRFEPDLTKHHHFFCSKCKKIIDFKWPEFDQFPLPDHLDQIGQPIEHQVEIRGICRQCAEKEAKGKS